LGPARRYKAIHPGSQRRSICWGRSDPKGWEVAAKDGCEALLRGALHGEVNLLPDKKPFIFHERGTCSDRLYFVWEKGPALTANVQRSFVEKHFK